MRMGRQSWHKDVACSRLARGAAARSRGVGDVLLALLDAGLDRRIGLAHAAHPDQLEVRERQKQRIDRERT